MDKVFARLGSDKRASVAPMVGLTLFALVGAGGIAFDYARMAALDTELQSAADQAALAGASQLDGEDQTCERAVAAARNLLANKSVMANEVASRNVTIADSTVCRSDATIVDDTTATIRFFQDKAGATPADNDSNAHFIEVTVDARRAEYALTPVVGAFNSGDLRATARAGLGTALCKVPPLMVCPPTGVTVDWNAWRGRGVRAVSNSGPNWAPGDFGYIGPQDANSTQIGLAFENPVFQCQQISGPQPVSSGAPTPAITAINTRFGIYDMSSGGGVALAPCLGASCPPAANVTKDVIRKPGTQCGTRNGHNNGNDAYHVVDSARRFLPQATAGTNPLRLFQKPGQAIEAMGLPRDNCHYTSFGTSCPYSKFGDGSWARGDYFNKYHAADIAAGLDPSTWTRYETYRWEIDNNKIPNAATGFNQDAQEGIPPSDCAHGTPDPARDRRVLQVAVGGNCPSLHGASTPVQISKWVEMFLVEPGMGPPGRGNGDSGNEIYLEVIREVDPGGAAPQVVRRDTPYLVR